MTWPQSYALSGNRLAHPSGPAVGLDVVQDVVSGRGSDVAAGPGRQHDVPLNIAAAAQQVAQLVLAFI